MMVWQCVLNRTRLVCHTYCTLRVWRACRLHSKFAKLFQQKFSKTATRKNLDPQKLIVLYSMFVWGGRVNSNVCVCSLMIAPACPCTCMTSQDLNILLVYMYFKWSACIYGKVKSTSNVCSLMVAQKSTNTIAFEALAAQFCHFSLTRSMFACWGKSTLNVWSLTIAAAPVLQYVRTSNMFKWSEAWCCWW